MAKKEKAKKPEAPEADAPAADGAEGAPAKKKMAGKTLVLFIILPAVLVIGAVAGLDLRSVVSDVSTATDELAASQQP